MKRFAFEETEMARVLMLMSHGQEQALARPGDRAPGRVFVCKTCNRVFPSFQALGGHRASHKKPRLDADGGGELSLAKPKLHGCSICGVEFAIGQALGGHMRRHRAMIDNKKQPSTDDTAKRGLWLDLNQPPCDDENGGGAEGDCGRSVDGLVFHQFLDNGPMTVDCVGYY